MKFEQNNGIGANLPEVELSADLDWMLQSQQVSNEALAEALVEAHFLPLFHFTNAIFTDVYTEQEAFNRVVDGLSWAVHHRQAYWGGSSVKVWLYTRFLRQIRSTNAGKRWGKTALRIFLCDRVGLSPAEAEAVVSNKRYAAHAGSSDEEAAERHLAFARSNQSDSDQFLLWRASEAEMQKSDLENPFAIPPQDEIVRLVLETASQAGVGRIFSRNVLQSAMLGSLLLALVIFVLYQTTIEREISARATPLRSDQEVTATPEAGVTVVSEAAVVQTNSAIVTNWYTLPKPLALEDLVGNAAEEHIRPQYSGMLALAAVIRYWGRSVDIRSLRMSLQPDPMDGVVMLYELSEYATARGFRVDFRLGGSISMLCNMVRAGYPVITQIGYGEGSGWDGQFVVVTGCDPDRAMLMVDLLSLPLITAPVRSTSDMMRGEISAEIFDQRWAQFAEAFLVVYLEDTPAERLTDYQLALDTAGVSLEENSYKIARMHAEARLGAVQGRELFFAYFSYATAMVYMRDYGTAATYFDAAFSQYNSLHPSVRPYRIMWYQTRPYWAYYYTGNYAALLALADRVLAESGDENTLEETYYWRALGKEGLGDLPGAIADLEAALGLNRSFSLAQDQLERIRAR